MKTELYVGNLPMTVTEESVLDLVSQHGPVTEVRLRLDRSSRPPNRFAFVTMATPEGAAAAIFGLNGREVDGHEIRVRQSVPPGERPSTPSHGGSGRRPPYR